MKIISFLNDNILWGLPMIIIMFCCGIYLTVLTRGVIFRKFGTVMRHTCGTLFEKKRSDGISPFQAVSTALAATVGTGNIVGVAVAIQIGGPGTVFWMWISALLGMVTKYSEVTLAVAYREKSDGGIYSGGPMYYIMKGLGSKRFAILFCVFGALSSFGIGNMVQSNSLAGGLNAAFGINTGVTGAVVAVLAALVLFGGIKRIAGVAEILVPFAALMYIGGAAIVLAVNIDELVPAFKLIFNNAFSATAAAGGFVGSTLAYTVRIGVARGIFTNEAGLGSAPIAHACADNYHPARQGLWGAFEVFFDTIIMCTVTALVILTSGLWKADIPGDGSITQMAFDNAFNGGGYIVTFGLVFFAFATIIAWYYYGECCFNFIFKNKYTKFFRSIFVAAIFIGSVMDISVVWEIADMMNGLMALPNLTALIMLAPVVKRLTDDFFDDPNRIRSEEDIAPRLIYKSNK